MKGIIFNILEQFVVENFGEETYDKILKQANLGMKEPFVSPGTYPDEHVFKLVVSAANELNISAQDVLKSFGKFTFGKLAEKFPVFVDPYNHPKPFLMTVESIIHVEVNKLYEGAYTPKFTYTNTEANKLTITYSSKRKLYDLMEGLIDGVGDYFKVPIRQSRKVYEKDGVEVCDFELEFLN
ncbi:MAG: hypothetical protein EPO57_02815 [Chitinophagaceae bacterium]|nr:MAG: hypothetical protein EPO57_02815 [Chitinophagaceae bacterium]